MLLTRISAETKANEEEETSVKAEAETKTNEEEEARVKAEAETKANEEKEVSGKVPLVPNLHTGRGLMRPSCRVSLVLVVAGGSYRSGSCNRCTRSLN